jgi:hypothetical protein
MSTTRNKNKRVFFFHYNKIASRKENKPKLTVHYKNTCYLVDHIICEAKTRTKHNKRQPHVVISGKSDHVYFTKCDGQDIANIM